MLKTALGLCVVLCAFEAAAQPPASKPIEPSIRVECHGKLRHGVAAIGGETTGTTITFDGMTWDLNLPDDASHTFAKEHHKKSITVVGSLRQVLGQAIAVRYIVDVERLSLQDAAAPKEGACLTILGTLREKKIATAGKPPGMAIEAENVTWPLDLSADTAIQAKAAQFVGKSVELVGRVERGLQAESPPRPTIRVNKLSAPTGKAVPKCST